MVGAGYGLGLARLLYESDPFRFAMAGGLGFSLGLGLVGVGVALAGAYFKPAPGGEWYLPGLLAWLYVFTSPLDVNPLRGVVLLLGGGLLAVGLRVFRRDGEHPRRSGGAVIVALLALVAYLLTLQRVVGRADTFEFQVTAPVLGVAHPTGYPLYILLGKLFSLLPLGKIATRVNLTSVVAATASVTLVYAVLRRALVVDGLVATLAALVFGFSPVLWSQAVVAEVYALHNVFVAAILGGALWLVASPGERVPEAAHALIVPGLLALTGLSLTNHLTTVLLIPALALALLLAWPRLTWKQWALAAGLFLAGLLIYAYIPLRWPALHDGRLMRFDEFVAWVTGSRFGGALQLRAWRDDPQRWAIVGRVLVDQYGWPGIILGSLGLVALVVRNWRAALVSAAVFVAQAFYGLNYLVPDIDVFLIPMFLVQALWIGCGLDALVGWAAAGITRMNLQPASVWGAWGRATIVTLFVWLPLRAAWTNGAGFDWDDERALEAWGRYVLSLPFDDGSVILADSEKIAPLEYLHRIEGLRPDMSMVVLGTENEYRDYLLAALAEGRTVYLQRFLPGLEGAYHLRSVGPLAEVGTGPLLEPPPLMGERRTWQSGVVLLGYRVEAKQVRIGEGAHLTLYWQAAEAVANNYQVRLRLVNQDGEVVGEDEPAYAVGNRYPTVAWKPGEIVPDYHAVGLPYTLSPGEYVMQVALSPPFSQDITPAKGGATWVDTAALAVEAAPDPPPVAERRLAVAFEGGALTSLDSPEQVPAGTDVPITMNWITELRAFQTESRLATEGDAETFAFEMLRPDADMWLRPILTFEPGDGSLVVSNLAMRCGWLQPLADSCRITAIRVEGEAVAQAVANFDNKILLTGVDFETGRLQPGQMVEVTLHWQGLRTMDTDYTVFVHLLGPDGLLHGQVDQWPVQGTFPTSTWQPGQHVEDRYLVPLDADAPPGSYQLEIGVYLLSTNTRLLVRDANGSPVDDKILLGGLIVPE